MVIKRKTLTVFRAISVECTLRNRLPEQEGKVKPSDFVVGNKIKNQIPVRGRELGKPQVSSHG